MCGGKPGKLLASSLQGLVAQREIDQGQIFVLITVGRELGQGWKPNRYQMKYKFRALRKFGVS